MKEALKKTLAFVVFLFVCQVAMAQLFKADNSDGRTIYYKVISSTEMTCEVTHTDSYSIKYEGNINIPSSVVYEGKTYKVTSIGGWAFSGTYEGLTSVSIPSSVVSIGELAFNNCFELTTVNIPSSVTTISREAFYACSSLTSISIPSSVTSIEEGTFAYCTSLTSVSIPSSVSSIGDYAFDGLQNAEVYVSWNSPEEIDIYGSPFGYSQNVTLCVPEGCKANYEKTLPWSNFSEIKEYVPGGGGGEEKCSPPEIIYENGKLSFRSATPGAKYNYTITCLEIIPVTDSETGEISLSSQNVVSVYASADGYADSEIVQKIIELGGVSGKQGDMDGDGQITMSDANAIVNKYLGAE